MALVVGSYQATRGLLGGKTIPVAMAGRTTLNLNLHRRLNLIKPKKCNDVTTIEDRAYKENTFSFDMD
jgi:hypothetical protein